MQAVMGLIILLVLLAIYFLPAIVAHDRKNDNASAILVLNLFLGWTAIGWVMALVWALTKDHYVALPDTHKKQQKP